ncbi:MAG TPA: Nif11 domain/cupin domain-containing protein, partial [Prochlorococcaceae cyanobacterium AMR_MDS_5431]|nr:Nif11 domain/cupin domain-containing protein [Prochlorococcaceae cyanobacterium AMR_MDS_5431]
SKCNFTIMAEHDLQIFLQKIEQLNQLVSLINSEPTKRAELVQCSSHNQVIKLTEEWGFSIGKRWGESNNDKYLTTENLLNYPCPHPDYKHNEVLFEKTHFRLERIHLNSNAIPDGQWNSHNESLWLLIIQGNLVVQLKGENDFRSLIGGDTLVITACHHYRVVQTDLDPGTIYLGLFWSPHD